MFKIIIKSLCCPAGPMYTKKKQADGSWVQDWSYGNGVLMTFTRKADADAEVRRVLHNAARHGIYNAQVCEC